jgi:hypothetical protein
VDTERIKWTDHLPLLVGLLSGGLVALKLLSVSNGDLNTALEILRTTGTASVLTGVFLLTLPGLLVLMVIAFVPPIVSGDLNVSPWVIVVVVLPLVWVTPVVYLIAAVVGFVVLGASSYLDTRFDLDETNLGSIERSLRYALLAFVVISAFSAFVNTVMWMPIERITLSGGQREVGFVLRATDGELRVLRDDGRQVVVLDPNDVESRILCSLGDSAWWQWSIVSWGTDQPSYPPCDD